LPQPAHLIELRQRHPDPLRAAQFHLQADQDVDRQAQFLAIGDRHDSDHPVTQQPIESPADGRFGEAKRPGDIGRGPPSILLEEANDIQIGVDQLHRPHLTASVDDGRSIKRLVHFVNIRPVRQLFSSKIVQPAHFPSSTCASRRTVPGVQKPKRPDTYDEDAPAPRSPVTGRLRGAHSSSTCGAV